MSINEVTSVHQSLQVHSCPKSHPMQHVNGVFGRHIATEITHSKLKHHMNLGKWVHHNDQEKKIFKKNICKLVVGRPRSFGIRAAS